MSRKTTTITLILIALVIITVLSFFIKIPYTISSKGLVYPLKEWTLSKTTDGNLLNVLKDNKTNTINHFSVTEFARGDASEFILKKDIFTKNFINKGDTVGYIISNDEQLKLLELEGKLATEKDLYKVYSTGQKPEDVQHQKEVQDLAFQEMQAQQKIFERVDKLYNDSLISKNDYEIALNDLKVKEHKYKIAQSYLSSVMTGAKTEQLEFNKSLIQSIEYQIEQIKGKIKCNTLLAPISGCIVKQKVDNVDNKGNLVNVDNILKVVDTSSLLAVLPVEFYEIEHLKIGGKVNISFNTSNENVQGKIIDIDNTIQMLSRREVVFITVEIKENIDQVKVNMIVEADIKCGIINMKEYLKRLFNSVTEN